MEKPENRGGKRRGSGRPPLDKQPKVPFPVSRVAPDVVEIIRQQPNMRLFVEEAIRAHSEEKEEAMLEQMRAELKSQEPSLSFDEFKKRMGW